MCWVPMSGLLNAGRMTRNPADQLPSPYHLQLTKYTLKSGTVLSLGATASLASLFQLFDKVRTFWLRVVRLDSDHRKIVRRCSDESSPQ